MERKQTSQEALAVALRTQLWPWLRQLTWRPLLLALAALTAVSAAAAADEGAVTTDELKSMCKLAPFAQSMGPVPHTAEEVVMLKGDTACTFYVAGIANLVMLPGVAKSLRFCLPKEMTMDQLRITIGGMMRDAPKEMLEYSAALSVIAGLRMHFPRTGAR